MLHVLPCGAVVQDRVFACCWFSLSLLMLMSCKGPRRYLLSNVATLQTAFPEQNSGGRVCDVITQNTASNQLYIWSPQILSERTNNFKELVH